MISRRAFLVQTLASASVAALWPGLSLARIDTEKRLVVVVLRGALDGLAAVPPYGESRYESTRGELALSSPGTADGALKLDGMFGLHPKLSALHEWYQIGDALVVHAAASPYRERSPFDGQNLLENGTGRPFGAADGWLNRAIAAMPRPPGAAGDERGIALGQNVPLLLRGSEPIGSWAPSVLPGVSDDTMNRIVDLYANDAFLSMRLANALETEAMAPDGKGRGRMGPQQFVEMADAAGSFLIERDGPRVAMLEATGWDTHANQGAHEGQLATRLRYLDEALGALRKRLGATWSDTVVLVVSEFGRTVSVNGTKGTDHGTAGVMFVAGGVVNGGRVVADWPGLRASDLYQGRDLMPTTDVRSVFKGILGDHLGVAESALETTVFPDSRAAAPVDGLIG